MVEISNADRARILVHALPYIQAYNGKIVVIKYGGNAMINENLKDSVMRDLVLLTLIGVKVVLVHGGGPEITDMLARVGKKTEFVDGLRVTDKETVEIVQMVLAGKINKSLVQLIETKEGRAIGLSGSFVPQRFKSLVDRFGSDSAAMKQAGIAYATDQIIDLYANGITNVHVYSMNNPDVARKIQSNLSDIIGK